MTNSLWITAVFSPIGGAIVGALIALISEPVRVKLYGPRLSVDYKPGDGRCVADDPSSQCRWARISVINSARAHLRQCQAFVVDIEQEQAGRWIPTTPQFVDPLVPEWAATLPYQKYKPRDLPTKTKFFVNVLAALNNELVLSVEEWPERLRKIFQAHGRYRLKIVVTGDQVEPKTVFVIVTWTGNWKFDSSRGPKLDFWQRLRKSANRARRRIATSHSAPQRSTPRDSMNTNGVATR